MLDTLGGTTTSKFIRTLTSGGALFPVFPLGVDGSEAAAERMVTIWVTQVRSNGVQLAEIGAFLEAGTIRVCLDNTYPLAAASEAHRRATQGRIHGEIALVV